MARSHLPLSLILALTLTSAAVSQPSLELNDVTATDNTGVPHATKLTTMTLELSGTPGAPFALLLSADAFDGVPSGETVINQGFFLKPWEVTPVIDSPVHPVFDGIGMEFIRTQLNAQGEASLNPDDVVASFPSPVFRFNASGAFNVAFTTPTTAFLRNNTPSGPFPDPLPIPLESTPGNELVLYMQIVELDVNTLNLNVGNGVKVVFDQVTYPGTVGYSEGQDANPNTTTVAARQTLGTVGDGNFADANTFAQSVAADFGGTFVGNVDLWRIALSEVHEGWPQSVSPVAENGVASGPDPNSAANILAAHGHASGLDFLTGSRPQLNNENLEFPRIVLPGGRELFHWRNADLSPGPTYGFGIYFRGSNTFRNLMPAAVGQFVGSSTDSPFEFEVGVTPDGDRALVIQNPSDGSTDRAWVLNLEEGGNFNNGLPAYDATPTLAADLVDFRRVWPQSASFLSDGSGGWVGFLCTSNDTGGSPSAYPRNMFRINMNNSPGVTVEVIPNVSLGTVSRVDRQPIVSADRKSLAVSYGQSSSIENIAVVTAVTSGSHAVTNVTAFPVNTTILETSDTHDGFGGTMRFSPDGTQIAFTQLASGDQVPSVVRADGTQAGTVEALLSDVGSGGQFDFTYFDNCRDVYLTADNNHLMFFQGEWKNGPPNDRFDFFVLNLTSGTFTNLTRTLATMSLNGPFTAEDPNNTPPTIDPAGYFLSPNEKYLYFFRDLRLATVGIDRLNVVAVSVEPVGPLSQPTFEMVNVTGTEFAALPSQSPPTNGTDDIVGDGSGAIDGSSTYLKLRRVGGDGPFADFAYMRARYADTGVGGEHDDKRNIDQLWLFDLNNPAPAFVLTDFRENAGDIPVQTFASITDIIPSQAQGKVAFVLDPDGAGGMLRDLLLTDLEAFGATRRIPNNATPFSRLITAGSLHFTPNDPPGLMYASGSVPRGSGLIDGVSVTSDPTNPIDATAYFHRFDQQGNIFPITSDAGAGNRRAVFLWSAGQ